MAKVLPTRPWATYKQLPHHHQEKSSTHFYIHMKGRDLVYTLPQ